MRTVARLGCGGVVAMPDSEAVSANLRTPLATRFMTGLLSLPTPLLHRIAAGSGPTVQDGHVLNPAVGALAALGDRFGGVGSTTHDLDLRRRQMSRFAALGMPRRTDVRVNDRIADLDGIERPVRIYRPFGITEAQPAIVYYHGGGWVMGDLDSHDSTCRLIAAEAAAVIVSVDYRLAPENPFPAAVDDAIAAYGWVVDGAHELGIDPQRVGVMGDSAGATLAAVTAQAYTFGDAAGDRPPPGAQGLVYPATDMRISSRSVELFSDRFFLPMADLEWYRSCYLPDEADWTDVRASPLLADDFAGLPPAVVITGGFDPLRDEGNAYAGALADAGVPVIHRCYEDMIHGFFGMGIIPGGYETCAEISRAVGSLLSAD